MRIMQLKSSAISLFILLCFASNNIIARQNAADICDPLILKNLKQNLKLEKLRLAADDLNVVSSACSKWPYKENLSIAALAYDDGVEAEKKLVIAVIDKNTKRVVSSLQKEISEDPITEVGKDSLKLDTARYQLAENIRAFGLVFSSVGRGASCGDRYSGTELTLYRSDAPQLQAVLRLNLWRQQWLAGCPGSAPSYLGFWEDADLTLAIANSSTNGLRDILVTAKIKVNSHEGAAVPNVMKNRKDRIERRTLKYDGAMYKSTKEAWWLGYY